MAITKGKEPSSFKEAVQDVGWRKAMQDEIEALERNGTWAVEDLPPGKKAIGSGWVYKIKYTDKSKVERVKARLVVHGNRQVVGVDFNETFAPVAKMGTDLGVLKYFLGIEVARSAEGIFLSQRKYSLDILTEAGMLGCKPIDTPMEQNHHLAHASSEPFAHPDQYRFSLGCSASCFALP